MQQPAGVCAVKIDSTRRRSVALVAAVLAWAPSVLTAQNDVQALAARCRGSNAQLEAICREAAVAAQAGHAGVGLLAAGGAPVPGAASTIGRRFGGTPRFALSLRGNTARIPAPDVEEGSPSSGESSFGFGAHASITAGLLDGFSLAPTVGGVLSLDLFAGAGVLLLPDDVGFQGNTSTWGFGASVGLLRESFTLPGVTLSLARRSVGDVQLGDRAGGDRVQVELDPTVTSVRGVVGKDLLAVGVIAGMGWDEYASDVSIMVAGPGAAAAELESSRMLYFGGVSFNFLLLQLSAEGGWAGGFDAVPGRPAAGYDPGDGSLFLSLAGRLTL
jgi:hypothetical protein